MTHPLLDTTTYPKRSLLMTLIIIAGSWCALLYPPLPMLELLADSEQYRSMGTSILDGSILRPVDVSTAPHLASVMRPPLFPLALAVTSLAPLDPSTALVILHALLALVILGVTPFALRGLLAPPFTALACGVSLYSAKQVLWGDMSEWLAMSCVFGSTVSYLLFVTRHGSRQAFFTSFFVALAILTRSALLPWLALPALALMYSYSDTRPRPWIAVALGLLPLVIWGGVQAHRFGSFSLGAYEGLNLLATTRSLGEVPVTSTDSTEIKQALNRVNERGVTSSDAALAPTAVHQWDGEFYAAFHENFDQVCAAVQTLAPHSSIPALSLAARGFWQHRARYLQFLRGGLDTFISDYAPLLFASLAASGWLFARSPQDRPLATVTATVSVATLVYLATVFLSVLWLPRYFIPIQPSVIFLTILSLFSLVKSVRGSDS